MGVVEYSPTLDCVTCKGLEVALAKDLKELRSSNFWLFISLACVW